MLRILALLLTAALFLAACGGDDEDTASPPPAATSAATEDSAASPGTAASTVAVAADPGGKEAYTETALSAKAGAVEIAFTNDAKLPHDVVIERDGDEVGRTDIISESTAKTTVELEAGEYTFYCSVGDHRDKGMEGTLTVE